MTKVKFKKTITVLTLCLGIASITHAQQESDRRKKPPTFKELLKEFDSNEDGKLAKKELKRPLKKGFTDIDINEDGFISEKEFEKAPKPRRKKRQ